MQRILIIGPCGAGKSTLAFDLAQRLALPVYHMDKLNWKAGWIESGDEALSVQLASIISSDRWLIDGNYGATLQQRLERADTVIYLDFPIALCVLRLFRRLWTYRGRTRPDMTEGCPERFDFGFLLYLLRWNSGPRTRTERHLQLHGGTIIRLKTPDQLARWLEEKVK
jgi:adenylate kinase family enzyme